MDAGGVQRGGRLGVDGAAVGVEAVILVHGGKGLHALERLCDLLGGEGPEGADLDEPHFLAPGPQAPDGLLGGAGGGADHDEGGLGVLHFICLDETVAAAGHGAEFGAHLADDLLGVHHGLGLLALGLHVVDRGGVGAHGHRLILVEQVVPGPVLAHKRPDLLRLHQLDVFDGVGGDEAVLTDHDGQPHRLADAHGLEIVVIGLLVGLGKEHQPAGVPDAHGVGVVVVDVDGAAEGTAGDRQGDGQAVGGGHVQHLGHVAQAAGGGGRDGPAAGGLGADAGGHGGVLALHRDELGVHLTVVHVGGKVLGDLGGGRNGEGAHHVGVDLLHGVGNGLIAGKSFSDSHRDPLLISRP